MPFFSLRVLPVAAGDLRLGDVASRRAFCSRIAVLVGLVDVGGILSASSACAANLTTAGSSLESASAPGGVEGPLIVDFADEVSAASVAGSAGACGKRAWMTSVGEHRL